MTLSNQMIVKIASDNLETILSMILILTVVIQQQPTLQPVMNGTAISNRGQDVGRDIPPPSVQTLNPYAISRQKHATLPSHNPPRPPPVVASIHRQTVWATKSLPKGMKNG
jgi:hypothetical protein